MTEPFHDGCYWIVGTSTKGVGASKQVHNVFCGKIRQEGSVYCPKHQLFHEDDLQEPLRRQQARVAKRKAKKERLATLAASPLASHNPRFDQKVKEHGGMDAEEK